MLNIIYIFQVVRLIILLWLVAAILSTGPYFGWNAYVAEVAIFYLIYRVSHIMYVVSHIIDHVKHLTYY